MISAVSHGLVQEENVASDGDDVRGLIGARLASSIVPVNRRRLQAAAADAHDTQAHGHMADFHRLLERAVNGHGAARLEQQRSGIDQLVELRSRQRLVRVVLRAGRDSRRMHDDDIVQLGAGILLLEPLQGIGLVRGEVLAQIVQRSSYARHDRTRPRGSADTAHAVVHGVVRGRRRLQHQQGFGLVLRPLGERRL